MLKIIKINSPITNDTFFIIGAFFVSIGIIKYDLFSPQKEIEKKIKDLQAIYFLKNTSVEIIHELKNKLFALVSKVDLLIRRTRQCTKPECQKVIGLMHSNGRDINEFINKILLYVKQDAEPLYEFELNALIHEAISSIGSLVPPNITIAKTLSEPLFIQCNANDIKSVVVNLLLNSIDAIENRKGELAIRTEKETVKNKDFARLTVSDNGKGIAAEHLDSIYELMFTTKKEGSGFGLFFVKKVIEKYQGKIEVQSQAAKGASFVIHLPLSARGIKNEKKVASA